MIYERIKGVRNILKDPFNYLKIFHGGTKVLNFVFDYPKKLPNRGEIIRDFLANSKAMEYLAIYKF